MRYKAKGYDMKIYISLAALFIGISTCPALSMLEPEVLMEGILIVPAGIPVYSYNKQGMPLITITFIDDTPPIYNELVLPITITMEQMHTLLQNGEVIIKGIHLKLPENEDTRKNLRAIYANAEIIFKVQPLYNPNDEETLLETHILEEKPNGTITHGARSPLHEQYSTMIKKHGNAYNMLKQREMGLKAPKRTIQKNIQ